MFMVVYDQYGESLLISKMSFHVNFYFLFFLLS